MNSKIVALHKHQQHQFSKTPQDSLTLIAGLGVDGDAHCGSTVKHRSRVAKDPNQPNLRQVHLFHNELLDQLKQQGFDVAPGKLGENITTSNIDLLGLPKNTLLRIGSQAVIQITGLRNPCAQLDNYQKGLTAAVLDKDEDGNLIRKAGVMAIVIEGGEIRCGDNIEIELPPQPHQVLSRV